MSERFGEPAAQHRNRGLHLVGEADHIQVAGALGGAGIILDLEGSAHRLRDHDALQVHRQRGDRELDVLEFLPRLRPLAEPRAGQCLPQLRIVIGPDRRIGKILQPLLGTAYQAGRDRMHDQGDRVL